MKKLLSVILAAAMFAAVFSIGVFADEDSFAVWVNGEKFSAEKSEIACGAGKAIFDAEKAELTLENAEIGSLSEYQPWCSAAIASRIPSLTIKLVGDNVISAGEGDGVGSDLGCSVAIVGSGKLTISAYYGIYVSGWGGDGGDLTIAEGATVIVKDSEAAAIWAHHDITFDGAGVFVDRSGMESYNGIVSNSGGRVVVRNSTVEVKNAAAALHFGNGDDSSHALVVESGSLTLISTASDPESDRLGYALFVEPYDDPEAGKVINGEITVTGGTLSLTSEKSGTNVPAEKITLGEGVSYAAGESLADSGTVTVTAAAPVAEFAIKLTGAKAYSDPERTNEITSAAAGQKIYLAASVGEKQYVEKVIVDPDVQYDISGEAIMPGHDLEMTFVIKDQTEFVVDLTGDGATVDALLVNGLNMAINHADHIEIKDEFFFDLDGDGMDDVRATVIPGGEGMPQFRIEAVRHDKLPDSATVEIGATSPYDPVKFVFNDVSFRPGDVNHDGKLNAKDVTAIMKYLVGNTPKVFFESEADYDGNGKINAKDVTRLMKSQVTA